MTNICYHRPTNREEAVVEGSNGVSATINSEENVERSEAVTETMDGSEARAAMLSVIRTNWFACAVSDDDDDDDDDEKEKEKKKGVLDLGETSKKPNSWQNILGASSAAGVSDVQKKEELAAAGWPSWLSAVAGEAIYGWTPRREDSFEKLDKIGQGLRSNVYKARDVMTGRIVALKKVRFDNLEPESVKFMAREILVLRRLNHPNVMKLEGLVTSKMSCSLYLVFEYMEHDLAGLTENPQIKFTEPQVKCCMYQLFLGLEYCHSHGVLHRDINGSNLLIDNGGILKIAGFGSASFFDPNCKLPSRVTTLWYRPPELLMGASDYSVGADLWSMGCVLAELLAGKPIMPGRTNVEQLHKIFKLCGSPSEEYWKKSKLPHATIFKPQQPYKRCIAETFKDFPPSSLPLIETLLAIDPAERQTATAALMSEFFTTKPYACEPSSHSQYPPSKEMDAKLRDEEAWRLRAAGKGNGDGVKKTRVRDRPIRTFPLPAPEANAELQANIDRRRLITNANALVIRLRENTNDDDDDEKEKKKGVLDLEETSKKPNWWQNILGASAAAGWPSWLSAVAGEAIYGWTPRGADSFKNLNKIGRGTRSKLYEARDILTGKIVTLKKVQFDSLKPESVKLMAKEILMLRRLDHPNVIKLEGVMISKESCGLYLVFQYMEHDLAGLAANQEIRFTESQVKCFMHQLLSGLKHCHGRGVLHRDINGSHLLIDNGGILKIAGFGSASLFDPKYKQDLTNRVDNLWYLSPEILLGATACGVGVDLWSAGCILAELLYGKAIMPGRIQVDQLHKIFGLCGFSSDEFWEKSNLPHATVFKPYPPYRQSIANRFKHFPPSSLPLIETFLAIDPVERGTTILALRSEFFKTEPYACDPPSLPKYPPKQKMGTSEKKNKKKIDAKLRDESRFHAEIGSHFTDSNSMSLSRLQACAGNSKVDGMTMEEARRLDRELEEIINGESLVHHGLIDEKGFLVLRTDILRTCSDAISTWGVRIIDAS